MQKCLTLPQVQLDWFLKKKKKTSFVVQIHLLKPVQLNTFSDFACCISRLIITKLLEYALLLNPMLHHRLVLYIVSSWP